MDNTITDRRTIKLLRLKKLLSCTFCLPNKGENSKRNNQFWKKNKSWKFLKKRKQYDLRTS